jgi:hypothetical protein
MCVCTFVAETQIAATEKFYTDIAELAKHHGVVVSVISIEGQECRLENLGSVADVTGGEVNKVDPLKVCLH